MYRPRRPGRPAEVIARRCSAKEIALREPGGVDWQC
jgi:hypothetical protein